MFLQNCVVITLVRIAMLIFLCTICIHQGRIYGTPLVQKQDGKNADTTLNESAENYNLSVGTPLSLSLLTRIWAVKFQLNPLWLQSHSDARGKKTSLHPFSDLRTFISLLWPQVSAKDDSETLSYSTDYESVQSTHVYDVSNVKIQGHDGLKGVKGDKPSASEPLPSVLMPDTSQNESHTQFNRKTGQSSGYVPYSHKKGYRSQPFLRMRLESDNFTFVYPGNDQGRQFFGSDMIFLKDVAFTKRRTWFLLKANDSTGEAYIDSASLPAKPQLLYCMVRGQDEIIYSGWHRWGNETSGSKSLSCETACKTPGVDPFTITNYHLRLDSTSLLTESEQRNIKVNQVICLQPSFSGLYTCISVDSKYNVFLSASHDIRIVNVVTSKESIITPPSVSIDQNDTRQTFVGRYCTGHFSPHQNSDIFSAQVDFFYTDEAKYENVSFTLKALHMEKWITADKFLENLNLSLPAIIRCTFDTQSSYYLESRYVEIYFRFGEITKKTQNTFNVVQGETFSFFCSEDSFDGIKPALASYFQGFCSGNANVYSSRNSSSIKLKINKEMCLKCSSLTSEIKLQINVEQDFRTLSFKANDEQYQSTCPVLDNIHTEYFSVENSDVCEQNAISLLKGTQQYRNRVMSFSPNTYKSYYTSRQFIVCRGQPLPGRAVAGNKAVNPSQKTVVNILIFSTAGVVALLLMLAWKLKYLAVNLIHQIRSRTKSNLFSRSLKRDSALFIDNIMNAMDRVHPRENIERSRITFKDALEFGTFGKIYKACLKSTVNSAEGKVVAVEEHTWPTCRKEKRAYIRQFNQQIQVLRVITPHINILRYYGFSISSESNLIVMEFMNGLSLMDYLQQQRTRIPGFVFKARNHVRSESSSEVTKATCSSADSEDSVILNNDNLCEMTCGKVKHELTCVSRNVQTEVTMNERKDSNSSEGDFSEVSDNSQGIWYVNFENDSLHNGENSEYHRESNVAICPRGFHNKTANENLVIEILSIYRQVARGMAHLSYLNIILCELAARDIIVQFHEHPLVVKICDFSSAYRLPEGETVYKRRITGPRRAKWLPPEAVKKGEFTVQSDVWTYGVFCLEVSTLGSMCYEVPWVSTKTSKAYKRNHLLRPPGCDKEIFSVIETCWKTKPEDRPSFEHLVDKWSNILEVNTDYLELRSDGDDKEILARL